MGNGEVAHCTAAAPKCHAGKKIFNGLSVASWARTCQVRGNLPGSSPLPPALHFHALHDRSPLLITSYTNQSAGTVKQVDCF